MTKSNKIYDLIRGEIGVIEETENTIIVYMDSLYDYLSIIRKYTSWVR